MPIVTIWSDFPNSVTYMIYVVVIMLMMIVLLDCLTVILESIDLISSLQSIA